jgi:hypothetical protein
MAMSQQPLDESTILTRFLIQPSSLNSIISFNQFHNLVPSASRNNEDLQPHLRRLYADLRLQRSVDLDDVRANIERECARSATLKARLEQDVAQEMNMEINDNDSEADGIIDLQFDRARLDSIELQPSRKRKRALEHEQGEDSETSTSPTEDSAAEEEGNSEERTSRKGARDEEAEDDTEIPESPGADTNEPASARDPRSKSVSHLPSEPPVEQQTTSILSARATRLDTRLDIAFHGPRGLALPSTGNHHSRSPGLRYHTPASLLEAMAEASRTLEGEIAELERRTAEVLGGMQETVGALSDLRYGKLGGRESDTDRTMVEVEDALRGLRGAVDRSLG